MPTALYIPIASVKLRLVSGISHERTEGGLLIGSRHTEPYWSGTFTTPSLSREDMALALAYLDEWVDLHTSVDVVHPLYRFPSTYTDQTWPLVADAGMAEVTDLRTIKVSGLSNGMVLPRGTRLSIIEDGRVCYRRLSGAVTVASESAQSLPLSPRIPPGIFTTAATVRFEDPFVRMKVVPDSWDPEEEVELTSLTWEMAESIT